MRAVEMSDAPGEAPRPAATESLWAALEQVNDPELPISLVDLGLIYDVRRAPDDPRRVVVELTYTAMGCPCTSFIRQDIVDRLVREDDVDTVEIAEVWSPAWTRARMTARGRVLMRTFGVAA
jgi:metal-sulfur cluster biosynthetic enzyme